MAHLSKKVCLMWGSPELDIFISRLIMDSRDGQRQGLPIEVGAELLFLAKANKIIRAIDIATTQKVAFRYAMQLVEEGDQKRLEADSLDNPLVSRDTVVSNRNAERSYRDRGPERRNVPDRRADEREESNIRRSGLDRRRTLSEKGVTVTFGQLVFRIIFSKAALFLIAAALTAKLIWPYIGKIAG
jgi:hypothetical protein